MTGSNLAREIQQIVEIDVPVCTLTYGVAPCGAVLGETGAAKCFGLRKTCQSPDDFAPEVKTLRYARNTAGLPSGLKVYPALRSVSTDPAEVNLGNAKDSASFGKRARLTISLRDFIDADIGLDPYHLGRRDGSALASGIGYNPEERGTHFGRLRARWPFYEGAPVRIREGFVGDALEDMWTRHAILSEWQGAGSGTEVTWVVKDILDLVDDEKNLCPKLSNGVLGADVSASATAFTLMPEGVGAEYEASGRASIGNEIVTFTRSGDDITLTGRGVDGTDADDHAEGDLFQQAFRVENASLQDVAKSIMVTYSGVPESWIPDAKWADEAGRWLAGTRLTTTIPRPVGTRTLMNELAELGVFWWQDDHLQEISMRANRPLDIDEEPALLSDRANIIAGTADQEDMPKQRLTAVLFWHGIRDYFGSVSRGSNFNRCTVAGGEQFEEDRIRQIYTRWLGRKGDETVSWPVGSRLMARFEDLPVRLSFDLDWKDRELISPGSLHVMDTRAIQATDGSNLQAEVQVRSIEETVPGHRFKVDVETFVFSGRFGFTMLDTAPLYDDATDQEKREGMFAMDETIGTFPDGTGPYLAW